MTAYLCRTLSLVKGHFMLSLGRKVLKLSMFHPSVRHSMTESAVQVRYCKLPLHKPLLLECIRTVCNGAGPI